ncbi:NUDIX domain-containing protein [Streptomyces luteogriseus]|uniref:NUDIX domain-containing protein n=1 Tax=Streptomyces luteogriseus TaxID=68233 RepID=UPI00379CB3F6
MCRRPEQMSRFPGHHDRLIGGAVEVGESCEEAAAREPAEELGVRARVRFVFTFFCRGRSARTGSGCTRPS